MYIHFLWFGALVCCQAYRRFRILLCIDLLAQLFYPILSTAFEEGFTVAYESLTLYVYLESLRWWTILRIPYNTIFPTQVYLHPPPYSPVMFSASLLDRRGFDPHLVRSFWSDEEDGFRSYVSWTCELEVAPCWIIQSRLAVGKTTIKGCNRRGNCLTLVYVPDDSRGCLSQKIFKSKRSQKWSTLEDHWLPVWNTRLTKVKNKRFQPKYLN